MPQVTNLRLLFHSSFPLLSPLKPSLYLSKSKRHHSLFTVLSFKRHRKVPPQSPNLARRNNSTLRESKGMDKGVPMEETTTVGFNKRRAEGRDNSDRPLKTLQLKVRTLNPANTISYVQILGTGMDTQDTSPSVLLFFDKQRFIFNAGEGLQRFCTEHKIKLSKIDHIFLSRVCSETAGGLPGLLLTLAGIGEEGMSVNVWGPSDMKYLVDAMRSFIPNAAMVHTRSFGPTLSNVAAIPESSKFPDSIVLIDDEVVKISAIILQPSCFEGSQHVNEEPVMQNASEKGLEGRIDHVSKPLSPNIKTGSAIKPGDMSVIYVCELPEIKGKFDPAKAMALGLKPGPKYRELQLGNSVKSDRQNIMVHPSDVMGPSVPGPIVFLVDCPTESHLEELLSIQSLSSYYADHSGNPPDGAKTVTCIIHLSPASVISSSNYQRWMERFGSAQHILAGHEMRNVEIPILKSSARIAARLNYLCPQFFPAPGFWSLQQLNYSASDSIAPSEGPVSKLCERVSAENLLKFTLRPYAHLGLDRACIPCTMAPSKIIEELLSEIPEIEDAAQYVSQFWHRSSETVETTLMQDNDVVVEEPWLNENNLPSCLENIRRDDLEIVLLGTGSSQPSKYRNVSSVYINLFSKGSLLLDCGEGTLGQLKRRYGVEGADNAVRGLRCIWISHIHADHHTGLARILALRRNLLEGVPHEPILVVGPRQLKKYLDAYQRLEDLNMQFLDCKHTTKSSWDSFEGIAESKDCSSPGSPINAEYMNKKNSDGPVGQSTDCTLFARGSRMQSYWKRPGGQVDNTVALLLKSLKKVLSEACLEVLLSFNVVHCPQAFGVMLKASERINGVGKVIPGWKIVYSGDTRPCPELIEASRGATVLIHEATFEDSMHQEAVARNHSTTKEAVEVGNSAGVYRIILTHFSQRYPKIPIFDETHMHKTCIAFDMMSVNIADLPVLPKVLPYLKLLFKNEMIVDESGKFGFGDVTKQSDWFCFATDDGRDNMCMLSEESCSSSAVRGEVTNNSQSNSAARRTRRRSNACISPRKKYGVNSIFGKETGHKSKDEIGQGNDVRGSGKFPNVSKLSHSNNPLQKNLGPNDSWLCDEGYTTGKVNSGFGPFSRDSETKIPSSGSKFWTGDPPSEFPIPGSDIDARSSLFGRSKLGGSLACSRSGSFIAEKLPVHDSPVFSKFEFGPTVPDLSPDSKLEGTTPESSFVAGYHGEKPFPDISTDESASKDVENKAKIQPHDREELELMGEVQIGNGLFSENEKAIDAASSGGNNCGCKNAEDEAPEPMQNLKTTYSPHHAEQASRSLIISDKLESIVEEQKLHCRNESTIPCQNGDKDIQVMRPQERRLIRKTESKCDNSSCQVMMLESYVLQLLSVKKVPMHASAQDTTKKVLIFPCKASLCEDC